MSSDLIPHDRSDASLNWVRQSGIRKYQKRVQIIMSNGKVDRYIKRSRVY